MKIQVERDVLAEAVAWTARALPARPAVPVLAGIRLQAAGDLTLSSFDYDVSAQATVPVAAEEDGDLLVSGRLLAEITRSLPARPVEISSDGARATLTCGSATFTLLTMPSEDYPSLPAMPPAAGSIGSDAFASAVSQSATAAGRDDTLPALTGVRIEIDGETLTLVSTDRYRLAVRELRWTPARPDLSAAVLVPARALAETARALTAGAEVSIALALPGEEGAGGEGMIGFEGAGRRTTTRLLGGDFPRYQSLLPNQVNSVAELAAGPFAEAVKRVALVAERNTAVRLSFSPGQLVLEAGHRRRGPGRRGHRGQLRGGRHPDRVQPAVPAGRADRAGLRRGPDRVHRVGQARADHRQAGPGRAARLPLPADADPPGLLNSLNRLSAE